MLSPQGKMGGCSTRSSQSWHKLKLGNNSCLFLFLFFKIPPLPPLNPNSPLLRGFHLNSWPPLLGDSLTWPHGTTGLGFKQALRCTECLQPPPHSQRHAKIFTLGERLFGQDHELIYHPKAAWLASLRLCIRRQPLPCFLNPSVSGLRFSCVDLKGPELTPSQPPPTPPSAQAL